MRQDDEVENSSRRPLEGIETSGYTETRRVFFVKSTLFKLFGHATALGSRFFLFLDEKLSCLNFNRVLRVLLREIFIAAAQRHRDPTRYQIRFMIASTNNVH